MKMATEKELEFIIKCCETDGEFYEDIASRFNGDSNLTEAVNYILESFKNLKKEINFIIDERLYDEEKK
jgi:hypothetical protein